jgi:Protein of unknown function (DUF2568)
VKAVAFGLRFLVAELGAVASFLWWGVEEAGAAIVVALVAAAAVVALWAAFVSPRAPRRLADPARLALELVIFAAATAAFVGAGGWAVALVYAVIAVATAAAARVWAEPAVPH